MGGVMTQRVGASPSGPADPFNYGGNTATGTSHAIPLSASIENGALVIILFGIRNGTITWDQSTAGTWNLTPPEGFDRLNALGSRPRLSCATKIADGSEAGLSLTITSSSSRPTAYHVFVYPSGAYVDFECVSADGDFGYDPPSLTPTWGSQNCDWIAVVDQDAGAGGVTLTTPPTGYGDTTSDEGVSASTSVALFTAQKNATSASEDPGVFTTSTGTTLLCVVATLAVRIT